MSTGAHGAVGGWCRAWRPALPPARHGAAEQLDTWRRRGYRRQGIRWLMGLRRRKRGLALAARLRQWRIGQLTPAPRALLGRGQSHLCALQGQVAAVVVSQTVTWHGARAAEGGKLSGLCRSTYLPGGRQCVTTTSQPACQLPQLGGKH